MQNVTPMLIIVFLKMSIIISKHVKPYLCTCNGLLIRGHTVVLSASGQSVFDTLQQDFFKERLAVNQSIYTNDSNLIALCRDRQQEGNMFSFMHGSEALRHWDFQIYLHVLGQQVVLAWRCSKSLLLLKSNGLVAIILWMSVCINRISVQGSSSTWRTKTILFKLHSSEIQNTYRGTDILMHLNHSFLLAVSAKNGARTPWIYNNLYMCAGALQ